MYVTTATSGGVVATYNVGVWQASGAVSDVNALLASVQFAPALNFNSGFNIAVNITDDFNTPIIDTLSATGTAVNDAPTVQNILQNKAFSLNQTFSFIAPENNTFFDPDVKDTLIYEATQTSGAALPAWISFNATENIFTGRADEAGVSYFKITATDKLNATASADFTITTLNPLVPSPVISPTGQTVSPPALTPNSISPTGQTISPPTLTPNSISPTGQTISPPALIPSPISTTALSPPTSIDIHSLSQRPSTPSGVTQPINNSTNASDLGLILGLLFGILGCASLSVAGVLLAWRFKLLKKLLQLQHERMNAQEENKVTNNQELGVMPDNSRASQYANGPTRDELENAKQNASSNNQNNVSHDKGPLRTESQKLGASYANGPTRDELENAKQNASSNLLKANSNVSRGTKIGSQTSLVTSQETVIYANALVEGNESSNNQTSSVQDRDSVRVGSQASPVVAPLSMQSQIKPASSRAISNPNGLVKNESSTALASSVTYANSPPVNKPKEDKPEENKRSTVQVNNRGPETSRAIPQNTGSLRQAIPPAKKDSFQKVSTTAIGTSPIYGNAPAINLTTATNDRASYDALRSSGLLASSAAKPGTNDHVNKKVSRIDGNMPVLRPAVQESEENDIQSVQYN